MPARFEAGKLFTEIILPLISVLAAYFEAFRTITKYCVLSNQKCKKNLVCKKLAFYSLKEQLMVLCFTVSNVQCHLVTMEYH